jgi:endonuclease YncB( thermonuclease family)
MGEVTIRLKGLDAPEMRQSCTRGGAAYACGSVARDALVRLIGNRTPRCRISGRDRYQRSLAKCFVDGTDLGSALVEGGYAVADGDYEREEAWARARSAGLWAGAFERPSLWRRLDRS